MAGTTNDQPKAIGIQLAASHESKMPSEDVILEVIKRISTDLRDIPILLIAPFDEERNFAREINSKLSKKVVVVGSPPNFKMCLA